MSAKLDNEVNERQEFSRALKDYLQPRHIAKLEKLALARGARVDSKFIQTVMNNIFRVIPNNVSTFHTLESQVIELVASAARDADYIKITLKDGTVLWTFPSRQHYRNFYYCFRDLYPSFVTPENYQALCDVDSRYFVATRNLQNFIDKKWLVKKENSLNVIECGAYVGWKALGYAKHIGEKGKVVAIEIDKPQFELCQRNLAENLQPNQFQCFNTGVWYEEGEKEYSYEHYASHSLNTPDEHDFHSQTAKTKTETLDNIIDQSALGYVDFINVQTGGSEYETVLGLERNLDKVGLIYLGTHYYINGESVRHKCLQYLLSKGFRIHKDGVFYADLDVAQQHETGGLLAMNPSQAEQLGL